MKAWLLNGFGEFDRMAIASVADPEAHAGEVIVDLKFAALNPADRFLAEGQYPAKPAWPHILGRDGVGTITRLGQGVVGWKAGDPVVVLRSEIGVSRWGTLAERVAVPAESVARVPPGWTDEEASAGPLVYLTAYQALTQWGEMPPGKVVLVTGASGGVGVATIQLGRAMGLRVLGLSRSNQKRNRIKELGAEEAFDAGDSAWVEAVKKYLGKSRVDIAVDSVAGPAFAGVLSVMGDKGKVSVVGRSAGEVPAFNTASLFFRRLRVGGVAVGSFTPPESQQAFGEIVKLLGKTGSRPVIDSVHSFDKVKDAFATLEKGPMGKVLVRVAGS